VNETALYRALPCYPRFWAWLGLWLLVTLSLLGVGIWDIRLDHAFATRAVHVQGQIVANYFRVSHGRYGDEIQIPFLAYRYEANGLFHRVDVLISLDTRSALLGHDTVPIKFLPEAPDRSRIDTEAENDFQHRHQAAPLFFGYLLLVGGGALFVGCHWQNRRWRRLAQSGPTCTGRVVSMEKLRGRGAPTVLDFEFTTEEGRLISARSQPLTWRQQVHWKDADTIQVHYDKEDPTVFVVDLSPDRRGS
jgi:hypothetical protein